MRIAATILLSFASTTVMAGPFEGTWDASKETCSLELSDFRLTISGNQANYWESTCEMVQATQLRDMGSSILYDLQCNGEGETYSGGRVLYSITAAGQLLAYSGGFIALRERCK
jgi:hypothetical protein